MRLEDIPTEIVLHIFCSCTTISSVLALSSTSRRFRSILTPSRRLTILVLAAEAQYGPLSDAIQLITHHASQPAHIPHSPPISFALLKQLIEVGKVAAQWEDIYPLKKWKLDFENRRLLTLSERYCLRRAIYRLWLYTRAFHNAQHSRFTRLHRSVIHKRAQLLHNFSTAELAELEDVRQVMRDVVQHQICPSNGTIQRKFRKRFPENDTQLLFNIHLNYPPPPSEFQQYFYTHHQTSAMNSARSIFTDSKLMHTAFHEPGAEGWGDEIPHYYIVEDMLKLDPGQILYLKEHAQLKYQVDAYIKGMGEWFENNGETVGQTIEWVLEERAVDVDEFREAIEEGELGITFDVDGGP